MIDKALLLIAHPDISSGKLGGIGVLRRQIFDIERAGFRELWIGGHRFAGLENLDSKALTIHWDSGPRLEISPPYAVLSDLHLIRPQALGQIIRAAHERSVNFTDSNGRTVVQIIARIDHSFEPVEARLIDAESVRFLSLPLRESEAAEWLLVRNHSERGFLTRRLDRWISAALLEGLSNFQISPNMAALLSLEIGLLGAGLFIRGEYPWSLAGAALIWAHSVLGGCVGDMAQIRARHSSFGNFLDFWQDHAVRVVFWACLGLGMKGSSGDFSTQALGLVAAAGAMGSAAVLYRRIGPSSTPKAALGRGFLERMSLGRDYVYILIVCAAFGLLREFLWAAAVWNILSFAALILPRRQKVKGDKRVKGDSPLFNRP